MIVDSPDTKVTIHNEGKLELDAPEGKHRILVFQDGEIVVKRGTLA